MSNSKATNHLKNSTSPYLLQHAHQPVDWYPWGTEALDKAKDENKPILLSIGYSSCHWCHVMAHESFDDEDVARYMNEHFVNIKLDREERPDIDGIYMDSIQAMGLQGGWPLNVFLTPNQEPFYGGTYFPKQNWIKLLQSIKDAYDNNYKKLDESAKQFAKHLQTSDVAKYGLKQKTIDLAKADFTAAIQRLTAKFDRKWGGLNKAPKFPMPCVWKYLAHYAHLSNDNDAQDHLLFTLDKIVQGGIYDQIGGGFARYAVDGEWHVPHFEKMLYDNGQLLSLFAIGYKISKKESYKDALIDTANWLKREMTTETGGFFSALDADSEGVEGKFYVWSYDEVANIAEKDINVITKYYDVSRTGNWEHTNVLRRLDDDETFCTNWKLEKNELRKKIAKFKVSAMNTRNQRIAPGLDNKIIAGWNGLALTGLLDAYQATGESLFMNMAKDNAAYIHNYLIQDNKLLRMAGQQLEGFLEDYAAVIQAFIKCYETVGDKKYLSLATELTNTAISGFYDSEEKLFYFNNTAAEKLIARKKELFDNVIPSSNGLMAENLWKLGVILDNNDFRQIAQNMIRQASSLIAAESEYMSQWSQVALLMTAPLAEVVSVKAEDNRTPSPFLQQYLPNAVLLSGNENEDLPLFENKKMMDKKTTYFVCFNQSCQNPTTDFKEALTQIQNSRWKD